MQIFFCDRCSARITEGELAEGDAYSFGSLKFCEECWQSDQVREIVARKSGLMAAVMEGGAGATCNATESQPQVTRKSPAHPAKGAGNSSHHRRRRHPSPKRLRATDHGAGAADRTNGRHRSTREGTGIGMTILVFGAAAVVTFLLIAGLLLFATGERTRSSAPDADRATSRVCDAARLIDATQKP